MMINIEFERKYSRSHTVYLYLGSETYKWLGIENRIAHLIFAHDLAIL